MSNLFEKEVRPMVDEHSIARNPLLSVVIALVSDTTNPVYDLSHLCGCIEALREQKDPPDMEIIVPYPAQAPGVSDLKERFPQVTFLAVSDLKSYPPISSSREHHDELRSRGIAITTGDIVALLEDHARPLPSWSRAAVIAHRQNYAGVGGAIENGIHRPLNWAVYFCDFGKYQNPVPDGDSPIASDANVAYKREDLFSILPTWQSSFHETEVNRALWSSGRKLTLVPGMVVEQYRKNLAPAAAIKERFVWGRSYAMTRSKLSNGPQRFIYAALSPLLPALLISRMALKVFRKKRNRIAFLTALPYIVLLTISWSAGELNGYLRSTYDLRSTGQKIHAS